MISYKKDGIITDGVFISLIEIRKNCILKRIEEENLLLLKMSWSGYRRGFDGILEMIVLSPDKIEIVKKYIVGKQINFGEIAGKHSEIYGILDEGDIEIIDDIEVILNFLLSSPNGHDYDYSFLNRFFDQASDGEYDDISKDDLKIFKTIFN